MVDDWTFKVKLAKPNGLYIFQLTNVEGTQLALFNKAYCSQFHPTYNTNADADAKAAGLADWRALFEQKCPEIYGAQRWMDPARPTLEAWVVESPPDATAEFSIFTRNPYYFKVDTEGNQLPYLDRINFSISNEGPDMILRAMNGQVDFQDRNINALSQKPVYLENAEKGGFHLVDEIPSAMNTMVLMFNQEVSDPGTARSLPPARFPCGHVARDRPAGNHRRDLCRCRPALPGSAAAGVEVLRRGIRDPVSRLRS